MLDIIENRFNKISIRGRLAFGVKCIEQYVKENDLKNKWIERIIDILWEFTSSDQLDKWDEKISDLDPTNILGSHSDNLPMNYKSLSELEFYELNELYISIDNDIKTLLENAIEIGAGNLYGGTGDCSKSKLEPTLRQHNLSNEIIKDPPRIDDFEFSKFSEQHGWGNRFKRERLK